MRQNLMTNVMERTTKMLKATDAKLKTYAPEEYGMKKATAKEDRLRFQALTGPDLVQLIQTYGKESVNQWLGKHMGGY